MIWYTISNLIKRSVILFFLLFFFSYGEINAQVVINEVYPNPPGAESGAEWVELYNQASEPVSLESCVLYLHADNTTQKVEFSSEDFIDKYETISWDDSWLRNTGDTVRLVCNGNINVISYGDSPDSIVQSPDEGLSIGRSPDGNGNVYLLSSLTPNGANSSPLVPTPTKTPTPTSTPNPDPTATPTPTPTPKPSPTNTPTPTLTLTPTPTEEPKDIADNENVLGQTESLSLQRERLLGEGDIESPDMETDKKKFPVAAGLFIAGGLMFIIGSGYLYAKYQRIENEEPENIQEEEPI